MSASKTRPTKKRNHVRKAVAKKEARRTLARNAAVIPGLAILGAGALAAAAYALQSRLSSIGKVVPRLQLEDLQKLVGARRRHSGLAISLPVALASAGLAAIGLFLRAKVNEHEGKEPERVNNVKDSSRAGFEHVIP
jgi:hypothetical protein